MGTKETYQQTLLRACSIASSEAELARRLDVPESDVVQWLLGHKRVPTEVFLRAVDIVLAASKEQVLETRNMLERIKRRRPKP